LFIETPITVLNSSLSEEQHAQISQVNPPDHVASPSSASNVQLLICWQHWHDLNPEASWLTVQE
jgi:hypothetical protein